MCKESTGEGQECSEQIECSKSCEDDIKKVGKRKKKRKKRDIQNEEGTKAKRRQKRAFGPTLRKCPNGSVFCRSTSKCQRRCSSRADESEEIECPTGTAFCKDTLSCTDKDDECTDYTLPTAEAKQTCLDQGKRYCEPGMECIGDGEVCPPALLPQSNCGPGETFCMTEMKCVLEGEDEDGCNAGSGATINCEKEGQVFCMDSQMCSSDCNGVADIMEERAEEEKGTTCPEGTLFCIDLNGCHEDCALGNKEKPPSNDDDDGGGDGGGTTCQLGQIYCMSSQSCEWENQCKERDGQVGQGEDNALTCPVGTVLCLVNKLCVSPEDMEACPGDNNVLFNPSFFGQESYVDEIDPKDFTMCSSGTIFCLTLGSCIPEDGECGDDDTASDESHDDKGTVCPAGTIFCLQSGDCSPDCGEGDKGPRDEKEAGVACEAGTIFCRSTGKCTPDCDSEDDDPTAPDPFIKEGVSCDQGMIFCLESEKCEISCGGEEDKMMPANKEFPACPRGMTFCMESESCTFEDCGRNNRGWSEEDEDEDEESTTGDGGDGRQEGRREGGEVVCPRGHIYCMTIDACVIGDCSVFGEEDFQDYEKCEAGEVSLGSSSSS